MQNQRDRNVGVNLFCVSHSSLTFPKRECHISYMLGKVITINVGVLISEEMLAPNIGAPQYIRQMLTAIKGEIDSNTVIMGDFNTPLTPMGRSSRQKINKETQALNEAVDQIDLIDIFRTFHPKAAEYTFFLRALGTFSGIDDILGYKLSLGKFKKIEIISSIFSNYNAMRLEINYRKKKKPKKTQRKC